MERDLRTLIRKSLDYYDNKNNEYKKFIKTEKIKIDKAKSKIILEDKVFSYEALGVFDNQTNVWAWSWMIPLIDNIKKQLSRKLLNYGLDIEVEDNETILEDMYLKTQFTNSRFLLDEFLQLEIHLALSSYLLKENIKFIYPLRSYLDKNKYVITYLLIK
mgnify:CR=1 FL=1